MVILMEILMETVYSISTHIYMVYCLKYMRKRLGYWSHSSLCCLKTYYIRVCGMSVHSMFRILEYVIKSILF